MITVYNSDSRNMKEVLPETVDLVVTSPPYNCGIVYNLYEDNLSNDDYETMIYEVLGECERVIKKGGRFAINVPWGVSRSPYRPVYPKILEITNKFFNLIGTIVWKKTGSSNLTSWGSWRSPSSPCLRDFTEAIIVGQKSGKFEIPDSAMVEEGGRKVSPWLSAERFMILTQDHWEMPTTNPKQSKHPTAFPIDLPKRIIELFGYPGCTVLDPFAGSGTTGRAALELGCNAILYDIDPIYCKMMENTLIKQQTLFE